MERDYPTVDCGGSVVTVRGRDDVQRVFETTSGFTQGTALDELTVGERDYEFDYVSSSEYDGNVLRAHVNFEAVSDSLNMAYVDESKLAVPGWERKSLSIGEKELFVVYELRPDT